MRIAVVVCSESGVSLLPRGKGHGTTEAVTSRQHRCRKLLARRGDVWLSILSWARMRRGHSRTVATVLSEASTVLASSSHPLLRRKDGGPVKEHRAQRASTLATLTG